MKIPDLWKLAGKLIPWATLAAFAYWGSKGAFNHLFTLGSTGDADPVNVTTQPLTYLNLTERKGHRTLSIPMEQVILLGKPKFTDYKENRDITVYYDWNRPLARSAGIKSEFLSPNRIIGHPAVMAVLCWLIQNLRHEKPTIQLPILHYGCYNTTINPDGWHNFGCAIDLKSETGYWAWKARTLGLQIQYCDSQNRYWVSNPSSSAGAEIASTCSGNHSDHLHLEITPTPQAWRFANLVDFREIRQGTLTDFV